MAKNRIEVNSIDKDGKSKTVFVKMPDSQDNKEAQLAYNKAFREALQSGAVLRQKLEKIMEEQGIWDAERQSKHDQILNDITSAEKRLSRGGISLSEAKSIALEVKEKRVEFRNLVAEKSSMDSATAEGQADNERFSHLIYRCILDESGKRVFKDKKSYEEEGNQPFVLQAASALAEKLYGLDPNYDQNLTENKFLRDYKFADDKNRLINADGHLIDVDDDGVERLINEEGRFIAYNDDGEQYFVDRDGTEVSEEGEYSGFTPFLDDSGKPVPVPEEEKEEEEEVAEAEEKPKPKRTPRKRTTKKSTTTKTE